MNEELHNWLIETFSSYSLEASTKKAGHQQISFSHFNDDYEVFITQDTTPEDILIEIKKIDLARLEFRLAGLPGTMEFLQAEIKKLKSELNL